MIRILEKPEPVMVPCGYCGRAVEKAGAERCWHCHSPLCGDCWEEIGHCGHPEAYQRDRELVRWLMREHQ
jgi:hypothetical protein